MLTSGLRILPRADTDAALVERFAGRATSHVSDAVGRLLGTSQLLPMHRGGHLLGVALTVRVHAGDNLMIHRALQFVRPGDVLVIDGGGDTSRALVGEIMKRVAQSRGARGLVIDGAVRDIDAFRADDFPCYARVVCLRGPYKNGPGEIGVTVSVGGMVVRLGDIIVGDADGVVAIPVDQAERIAEATEEVERREAAILNAINNGAYDDRWIEPALAAVAVVDERVARDRSEVEGR